MTTLGWWIVFVACAWGLLAWRLRGLEVKSLEKELSAERMKANWQKLQESKTIAARYDTRSSWPAGIPLRFREIVSSQCFAIAA
jgi:hypothetical protein